AAAVAQAKKQQNQANTPQSSSATFSDIDTADISIDTSSFGEDITLPNIHIQSVDADQLVAELNSQNSYEKSNLLKELSFENLVEGRSNALVVTAAKKIIDDYSEGE